MDEAAPALADPRENVILIVDDDEGALELAARTMEGEGFRIERVSTGGAVLRQVQMSEPDLILLDLLLPGRGGYEILRELQACGMGHIPVVVMTARIVDHKTTEMIKQEPNVRDFVQKPFLPDGLAMMVHRLLKTRPAGARPAPERPSV